MMDLKDNSLFLQVHSLKIRLDISQSLNSHSIAKQETYCFSREFILWGSCKDFLRTLTMIMWPWFIKIQFMAFLFCNAILLLECAYHLGSMCWSLNGISLSKGNHRFIQFGMEKTLRNRENWRVSGKHERGGFLKNRKKLLHLSWKAFSNHHISNLWAQDSWGREITERKWKWKEGVFLFWADCCDLQRHGYPDTGCEWPKQ